MCITVADRSPKDASEVTFSVNKDKKQIELSLRSNTTQATAKQDVTYGALQEGQTLRGKVKKVETFGVFIEIENSKLSGLCHKSEVRPCAKPSH